MAKYVECAYCSKRIDIGDDSYVVFFDGSVFCDVECFVDACGNFRVCDESFAEYHNLEIFDDEIRANELRESIAKAKRELQLMELELADITGDHTEYLDLMMIGKRKEV